MVMVKEFSIVAGFACLMAGAASSATTTFSSIGGSGFFLYQDSYFGEGPAPLPQFDPAIAKDSFLQYVSIEFRLFAETAGGYMCDSEGNSEFLDSHVTVSLLGSTYSQGGSIEMYCDAPYDLVDFSFSEVIYDLITFDVSKDDLSLFIGKGIIPIFLDFGGDVTSTDLTYEILYGFEPLPSAVPLPASGWLLMAPLIGLLGARRRNRKHSISNG